jgi:hypothetical protein
MEVTSCAVSTALAPYLTLLIRLRAEPFACEQRRLELTHGQRETVDDRIRANVLIDAEHIEASIWSRMIMHGTMQLRKVLQGFSLSVSYLFNV